MGDKIEAPSWTQHLAERVGKGDVRENLFELGMEIITFFRQTMPLMMMSWSNPGPHGLPHLISGPNPLPIRALKQLTSYFEAEMRAGRLRVHDPEIVARNFLGAMTQYVFFEVLHASSEQLPMAQEMYLRGLVNLLWTGVAPAPQSR
jgi:hypothetical protein